MDLAVAEHLTCPNAHASTPLVVRADTVRRGRLIHGLAGCPVCFAEWPVRDGVLSLGEPSTLASAPVGDATTIAALLALSEPGMLVLADGLTPECAAELESAFGARVVAFDCAPAPDIAVVISGASRAPLPDGMAVAAALLREGRSDAFLESIVRALRPGGRCVGSARVPAPDGLAEIARDDERWVAERVAQPVITPIQRSPGRIPRR